MLDSLAAVSITLQSVTGESELKTDKPIRLMK